MQDKLKWKYIIENIVLIGYLLIVALPVMLNSPLNPWTNGASGVDSSVFRYMGELILHGYMPYKDSFDHKGPLLYLINAVGQFVSCERGIWYVEYLSLFIFLFLTYKTARLVTSRVTSAILTIAVLAPLFTCFEGGNLVEEYAMPFIACALYIFEDYFLNQRISKKRLFLCGLCFGAVCLLRINMISVWIVYIIAVLVWNLYSEHCMPWRFIPCFLLGALSVMLPIVLWLVIGGAFNDFLQDYFLFNFKYSSSSYDRRYDVFLTFGNAKMLKVSVAILLCLFIIWRRNIYLHMTHLICVVVTLIMMAISGKRYWHYAMVTIPLYIYPFSMLCRSHKELKYLKEVVSIALACILIWLNHDVWYQNIENSLTIVSERHDSIQIEEGTRVALDVIEANTSEDDKIMVLGNWDFFYVQSNRFAASKFSYQIPVLGYDSKMKQEFIEDLETTLPYIVILTNITDEQQLELFSSVEDQYTLLYIGDNNCATYRLNLN